ncbi:MAG TPA: hypothetical protein VKR32_12220 [Puia sp.]|nr:hypothetical protein [Puia sp.]
MEDLAVSNDGRLKATEIRETIGSRTFMRFNFRPKSELFICGLRSILNRFMQQQAERKKDVLDYETFVKSKLEKY